MARSPYFLDPSEFQPGGQDIVGGYEDMIRGGPRRADRQMGLMGRFRDRFYGPDQGIAGPVPRGTPDAYGPAMGLQEPEPMGPPQPAERVPETGGAPESRYRDIADQYLQSLTQPYRLPEPTPYSKREKLGMLAAREPWQREMIVSQHREPYERAMAEAQIGERRRSAAAGVASDLEKAGAYERSRRAAENRPSQDLDYTDKVEKAQADVGNADYPYTKPQWKALAEYRAGIDRAQQPGIEDMLNEIDKGIRAEEDQVFQSQARTDLMGNPIPGNEGIGRNANERKSRLMARRQLITDMLANVPPDIRRKVSNLRGQQLLDAIQAYERRQSEQRNPQGGQLGPVAPSQPYYP